MQDRIRGRKRQEIRQRLLRDNPLCVVCEKKGRVTLATEIDHTIALVNGGTDTDDNRQGLCADCHASKTRRDLGQSERTRFEGGRVVW